MLQLIATHQPAGRSTPARSSWESTPPIGGYLAHLDRVPVETVSPSAMLRSFYCSLLEIIQSRTMFVLPVHQPQETDLRQRYDIHAGLVDAIEAQALDKAEALVRAHNTNATHPEPADPFPPAAHA